MSSSLGRFLSSIVDPMIDASLVDNATRLLDVLNGLSPERLHKVLTRTDERGFTPLHLAAERNQPESLKCLLIKDANPNIRSTLTTSEVTPLHIAARHGHLACLQLLVQLGGDIMVQDRYHLTPVDYAQINGQDLCFNYLNEVIAQRQEEERTGVEDVLIQVELNLAVDNVQTLNHWKQLNDLFPLPLNSRDPSQIESIMYRHCIIINNRDVVRVLGRICKDIPISLHGASLLHAACRYGRTELARLLVTKMPEIMFSITNEAYNPLHVAVVHQHLEIVKILVSSQSSSSPRTQRGTDVAASERDASFSSSLHLQQARFGEPTMSGHTVHHFAVALNNADIVKVLVRHHRRLKLSCEAAKCGYTALHLAVFLNHTECTRILLKSGANPNASLSQTTTGELTHISRSILSEAVINKNLGLLQTLIDYGGEDRAHSAIKICIPSAEHRRFIIPLLGSLIRLDDGVKLNKQPGRKVKTGVAEWTNLQLAEIDPAWVSHAIRCSKFLKTQKIESGSLSDYLTTINLSGNSLSWLPPGLFQLGGLQVLNVSSNSITGLPDLQQTYNAEKETYEWSCRSLARINLSKNQLSELPHFLFKIPSLSHLDVSNNQLVSLPFDLWSAPKLYQMVGSFNKLEYLPTNWPGVLSTHRVVEPEPASDQQGEGRERGKGGKGGKRRVARSGPRGARSSVIERDSEDQPITRLQDCLNISNSTLPIEWGSGEGREEVYEGLGILNLSNNLIREIPENFPCLCPKLIRLDLSHNQIRFFSFPYQLPPNLKHISLSYNLLETLDCTSFSPKPLPCTNPLVLAENPTIYRDNVSFCSHRQHYQLSRLSNMEMTNCQLREVNLRLASHSRRRKDADDCPHSAQQGARVKVQNHEGLVCPLLTRLLLSHNILSCVPDSICDMVSLNSLDLSHNDIIELPPRLGRLSNLWEFPLDGLKLISPPHNIIERGKTRDIIGFLWSLLQRARPYHRMKLMLVGKAARGKTTLLGRISEKGQRGLQDNWALMRMVGIERLKGNLSTVGIVVSDWTYYKRVRESQTNLRSITFMTWDFGGQEEYYATHQCFISRRSLYLVVWNVTHGMAGVEELRPWLLNIQARAPNSPVIIVATHYDKLSFRQAKEECRECQEYIARVYGTPDRQREGFPQIMRSMIVSCKSGRGINELRDALFDVASQVKENTVAGRGIGCGRIPDYRLLMDQLVPASYLQLEDTVRNLAIQMKHLNKPPVLSYKELRELVFADSRTLISRHSADRELEQAVRFLHDNGTLLHYEDPLLADFYFVDPQWLCDMLAHIITVREINPFVREGVMRIADFSLIFNTEDFPMRWKREYIRLLTTFEVAVELSDGELLIPSSLPCERPNLPKNAFPNSLRVLPPLRHAYIIPFVPSGFWPRLMSRVLSDKTMIQLERNGCNIEDNDVDQLSWVKWREGLILQYGNLNLMTIQELKNSLFSYQQHRGGLKIFKEGHWDPISSDTKISGISVTVPDFFPVLKFLEHSQRKTTAAGTGGKQRGSSSSSLQSTPGSYRPIPEDGEHSATSESNAGPQVLHVLPEVNIETSSETVQSSGSHDSGSGSHDRSHDLGEEGSSGANRVVEIDKIEEEIQRLARRCKDRCRLLSCNVNVSSSPRPTGNWGGPSEDGTLPNGVGLAERQNSFNFRRRFPSNETASPRQSIRSLSRGSQGSTHESAPPTTPQPAPPKVEEEAHDKMRAGLMSKAVDHITLLIEDWFTGVKPRYHLVPCPHCSSLEGRDEEEGRGPHQVSLLRSFSAEPSLQTPPTHASKRKPPREKRQSPGETRSHPPKTTPTKVPTIPVAPATAVPPHKSLLGRMSWRPGGKPQMGVTPKPSAPSPGQYHVDPSGNRYLIPERDQRTVQDPYNYAFRYEDCVVLARSQDFVTCPAHGKILLRYMAPDTLFVAQGSELLVSGEDCLEEGVLGQGAYATVFQVRIRKKGESEPAGPFALKALTKEWTRKTTANSADPTSNQEATPPKPPSRYSIIQGFINLKKELALLSPLKNPHVIQLHGVVLCPLGLILEHAPGGSLKKTLEQFHELQQHLHGNVVQAVIIQVALAIRYLHTCSIIYRDLKSDNVLVWRLPMPQDSALVPRGRLGLETVLIKLSDLGISQFAATQGARGLVGTPGYMAPEILKYHGKEVYTNQVDIFSFGMFMYELLTLHIPYENLTAQQANQANESGSRPALTRKDLECAVLLRELMVWCWQQHPDHRPLADDIISTAQSEQFLRLLNGIRVSRGQVTAACVSLSSSISPHAALTSLHHRQKSPRPQIHTTLANPFVPDRQSTDSGLLWMEESRIETQPDAVLLSGVKMHQRSVGVSQDKSSGGQVGDEFHESEQIVIEVQIESELTRTDTGDTSTQQIDDASNTFDQTSDTWNTLDDVTDTGNTHNDPTDAHDTQDDPTDTRGTQDDSRDTFDAQDDPTDTGNAQDDPIDTCDTQDYPVDTHSKDDPAHTDKRQQLMSTSGTSDTGFSSKLCITSEPDSTPPPPDHTSIRAHHTTSDQIPIRAHLTPSDHTSEPGGSTGKPVMTISDCYHPNLLINQFSETPSPPDPPHSWSPTPQRPRSTPAKFPSPDPQAPPPTKFLFPGPLPHTSQEPHPPIRVSADADASSHLGSKVTHLQQLKSSRWSEEREEEEEEEVMVFSPAVESLSGLSEEEAGCEVWVASCDAHRAVLSVVGYSGQFTSLEEIDMGDSPILALCPARGRVWVGFQIGHLLVFDSTSHHLLSQTWLKQYTPIVSIVHVPQVRRVFVTLATGSLFAFDDEVEGEGDTGARGGRKTQLQPMYEYHDLGQPASCMTAVPHPPDEVGGASHELWVGQSEAMITILDPRDLSVIKFLRNTSDKSPTPSYMAYLTYTNLVFSSHHSSTATQTQTTSSDAGTQDDPKLSVSVYGALCHGQHVTQWSAGSKEVVTCHDCQQYCDDEEDCNISSLHCHTLQLLVGLCSGKILLLDALTFSHLSSLTCHRGSVQALFTLSPPHPHSDSHPHSSRYSSPHWVSSSPSTKKKASRNSLPDRPSLGSMSLPGSQPHSADPSPVPCMCTPYSQYSESSILSNSQSTSSSGSITTRPGTRLLSFGSGFRSYYDGPESIPHLESGFMLVWDLHSKTDTLS